MIIAIILSSTILSLGLIAVILYFLFNKDLIANDSGKVLFEINYSERKIRTIKLPALSETRIPNSQKISKFYSNKWMELDDFMLFWDSSTNKKMRNALYELWNERDFKLEFEIVPSRHHTSKVSRKKTKVAKVRKKTKVAKVRRKTNYKMFAILFKCENGLIGGEIKFKIPPADPYQLFNEKINSKDIIGLREKYVGLWVFNLREITNEQKHNLYLTIKKSLRIKHLSYFVHENKLVIVLPTFGIISTNYKIAKRKMKIEKAITGKSMRGYYDHSGIVFSNRIDTPKKLKDALIKLDYLIWKSAILNGESEYKEEDIQEFDKFKKAYITVSQAIKAKSMDTLTTKVRRWGRRTAIVDYLLPEIKELPSRYFSMILFNDLIRKKMMNSHAEKMMKNKNISPSILDVNAEWLIKNSSKIKNKKIVYMIEYSSKTQHKLLFATIMQLQETGIMCGVRIIKPDIRHITALTRVAPKFIVIDRDISKIAHQPETYVKLAAIKTIANKSNIIYELPSKKIDANQRKTIGLKAYYDYK